MYLEGSYRVLIEVASRNFLGGTEEYHRKIGIAGVPSGVRNKHLPKTCLELYNYTSPLGENYLKKKQINVIVY
jgi:hypothetical protein